MSRYLMTLRVTADADVLEVVRRVVDRIGVELDDDYGVQAVDPSRHEYAVRVTGATKPSAASTIDPDVLKIAFFGDTKIEP